MQQEFTIAYGKLILMDNSVCITTNNKWQKFRSVIRIIAPLLFAILFINKLLQEQGPRRNFGLFIYGLMIIVSSGPFIYAIFRQSFSNKIPLGKIDSYEILEDHFVNQIQIALHLSSGRERRIVFLRSNDQLPTFVKALSELGIKQA